jgi:hypothetical protein
VAPVARLTAAESLVRVLLGGPQDIARGGRSIPGRGVPEHQKDAGVRRSWRVASGRPHTAVRAPRREPVVRGRES